MKPAERDNLLSRLDERSLNLWHIVAEQENSINKKIDKILEHQVAQNGCIKTNTIWLKVIIAVGSFSILTIVGWLVKLTLGG